MYTFIPNKEYHKIACLHHSKKCITSCRRKVRRQLVSALLTGGSPVQADTPEGVDLLLDALAVVGREGHQIPLDAERPSLVEHLQQGTGGATHVLVYEDDVAHSGEPDHGLGAGHLVEVGVRPVVVQVGSEPVDVLQYGAVRAGDGLAGAAAAVVAAELEEREPSLGPEVAAERLDGGLVAAATLLGHQAGVQVHPARCPVPGGLDDDLAAAGDVALVEADARGVLGQTQTTHSNFS